MFEESTGLVFDQEKEYKLKINVKDEEIVIDDLRATIKVDDEIILPDTDGKYVKVVPAETDNVVLWAGINSETSKVKIEDVNGSTAYTYPSAQKNISLQQGVTEAVAIVENAAGTTKEYVVYIIKDDELIEDAELKTLLADGTEVDKTSENTYTVNISADATSVTLEAIANFDYAKVSIDGNKEARGKDTKVISVGKEDRKTIKIYVTSITGDKKEYTVNIQRVQDELSLEAVYLNNRIATKVSDTVYEIDVQKGIDFVDLKAITVSEDALVKIANNTATTHINSYDNYLLRNGTSVEIIVTNSSSSESRTYTLNIKEKTVTEDDLQVDIRVDGRQAVMDTDGNYVVIVDREKVKSNVWAKVNSTTSKVNILDNQTLESTGYKVLSATKDINLTEKITKVTVDVENGNGDKKSYTLYIIKDGEETDDATLKSLLANDVNITPNEDGIYVVEIAKIIDEVKLVAETTLETSKVSIAGNTQTRHTNTETISMKDIDKKIVKIVVTSVSGISREYTVEIHKEYDELELEAIYVDGRMAVKTGENEYSIDITETTNKVDIEAVAHISTDNVQIDGNLQSQGRNTYAGYNTISEITKVPVKVLNDDMSESKEYILTITKTKDELQDLTPEIKVDGNTILPDVDGIYIAIVESNKTNSILWAGIDSETSVIKIDDSEYQELSITENVVLDSNEITKKVYVKNGKGTVKEYTVIIIKETEDIYDAELKQVIAGQGAISKGEVVKDENGIYNIEISKNASSLNITAIANYEYAKVSIDGNKQYRGTSTSTIDMKDIDEKTIAIKVESVSGIIKTYIVNIYRQPSELALKNVYVDNRLATKVSETEYTIDVVSTTEQIDIRAILYNETSEYVSINGNEPTLIENTFDNYELANGNVIEIKVSNGLDTTAEDYIEKVYKLTITTVEDNDDLRDLQLTITVDNKVIEKTEDGKYIAIVNENIALVGVKATSNTTKVKINDSEYASLMTEENIVLTDYITEVNVYAVNGAGDELTEKVWIVNGTEKAILEKLEANGKVITPNDEGIYVIRIDYEVNELELIATASQELAYVSIAGNEKTRGINTDTLKFEEEETKEITIKVESLDGSINEYNVFIDRRKSKITGKVITQATNQENQTATITLYRSEDTRNENDKLDPREKVQEVTINPDGTYVLSLLNGTYDLVITKPGYLEYRIVNIELTENIELEDINIYAGDVVETGEIEIDDLVSLNDHIGLDVTDEENAKYDLNEDGVIDKLDRDILKANYTKMAEVVEYVKPEIGLTTYEYTENELNVENSKENTFVKPINCEYRITSEYGYRIHPVTGVESKHTGIDLAGTWHTEVVSVADGEVVFAGVQTAFGNCVEIKHEIDGETIYSFYAHLSEIDVEVGQKVKQGETIGLEGGDPEQDENPGYSTGHHLHFELRNASGYGNDIDPNIVF